MCYCHREEEKNEKGRDLMKNSQFKKKLTWLTLSIISTSIIIATAFTLIAPKTAEAELGTNTRGNNNLAYWGGNIGTYLKQHTVFNLVFRG